nr:sigma-70 family RNA polymerase sigma factor [Deltaproteobacteria bacterium]
MTSSEPAASDQELLAAWQAGDLAAGNTFVERYFLPVYRFFVTKIPREADDLTQQTFADLQKAVGRTVEISRGRAYVMKIARNRLYMFLRSRAVENRVFDPEMMSVSAIDAKPSPSGVLAQQRDVRLLLGALRSIPVDAQVVLELYYWEDMPVRDIADIIGVQPGTVMSRL